MQLSAVLPPARTLDIPVAGLRDAVRLRVAEDPERLASDFLQRLPSRTADDVGSTHCVESQHVRPFWKANELHDGVRSQRARQRSAFGVCTVSTSSPPCGTARYESAAHSGRQFNFAMGRVLGAWALPAPPPVTRQAPFVRYTVPALEMSALKRARRRRSQP